MFKRLFGFSVICFLIFPLGAQNTTGIELAPELEKEAKEIENLIIAPCCWRQPVSVHFSPAADEVKIKVRQMLASGKKREEILDTYIAEFGERILAKPRASGFNALAYFLPLIFLVTGAGVAFLVIRRLRPKEIESKPSRDKPLKADSGDSSKLEKEMWG